jgi:hypothetical protein
MAFDFPSIVAGRGERAFAVTQGGILVPPRCALVFASQIDNPDSRVSRVVSMGGGVPVP